LLKHYHLFFIFFLFLKIQETIKKPRRIDWNHCFKVLNIVTFRPLFYSLLQLLNTEQAWSCSQHQVCNHMCDKSVTTCATLIRRCLVRTPCHPEFLAVISVMTGTLTAAVVLNSASLPPMPYCEVEKFKKCGVGVCGVVLFVEDTITAT
jgi:hypothetical protein